MKMTKERLAHRVYGNVVLLGILSLIWLLLRSGKKPTRLQYPCQRAALANSALLLTGTAIPIASRIPRLLRKEWGGRRARRLIMLAEAAGAAALAVMLVAALAGMGPAEKGIPGGRSFEEIAAAAAGLETVKLSSDSPDASDIYVAEKIPSTSEEGVATLINVMGSNGLDFFRTSGTGKAGSPGGIVGSDDIVLIKVNGEWRDRGGTNTDVVKGIIDAVVHHPEGFTGEVAIVENGQWDSCMDNRPDNRNPDRCNAEDRGQSFNDVAVMFAGEHRVSVYDWTAIQHNVVGEFCQGDYNDGYVYVPEKEIGYPKFTTAYGTRISLRHGYWNGSDYDNQRVRFINVPVLKSHRGLGVTASVKHYMGVQDRWRNTDEPPHGPMQTDGFMGTMMLLARYPDLNIVDAIWVCPAFSGPDAPYDSAVRLDRLLASTDPIALDYYCGKYVLWPVSGWGRHDPNCSNSENPGYGNNYSDGTPCIGTDYNAFNQMMVSTCGVLAAAGKQVTMDEGSMNVYSMISTDEPPDTPYEYFLAEGCTGYGFETWVLVANPNDEPATVYASYLTENGCMNRDPVQVPGRSRLTLNAANTAWAMSSGIRVGSDRPVYVERAMYWDDRVEGHDSIGTDSPSREWYLAEGCTMHGFETWIEILNPGKAETTAAVTYMTGEGAVEGPTVEVPARSRSTVRANDHLSSSDLSTRVVSQEPVVVERSMYWDSRRGGHGAIGVKGPSQDWYFPEGATHSGFETYLLLMNPGDEPASVVIRFMTGDPVGGGVEQKNMVVPARSRRTVKVNDEVSGEDVSTAVHSEVGIIAERSMFWPAGEARAGHDTQGMAELSYEVFLPEGCTDYGFDTWLLVQNPGDEEVSVSVYAMTEGGETMIDRFTLQETKRKTVRLADHYVGNLSIRVESTGPVACERSVYWHDRGGGTCSIGYGE